MGRDKRGHLIAGCAIAFFGGLITEPSTGLVLAVLAGLGKEIYDGLGHGTVELADLVATVGGGVVGSLAVSLLKGGV